MDRLICALSTHSSRLNIYLFDGKSDFSFSKKILNMDDILFKEIDKGLRKLKKSFTDISALCIVKGPGRFTGIRISYTFASILKVISRCKVYGVDGFDLLAYKFFSKHSYEKKLCVVLRAFKNEYYYCLYKNDKRISKLGNPKWVFEDDLLKFIEKWDDPIISDEEESNVYNLFKDKKIAAKNISRILPIDVFNSAFYFKNTDIKPLYLKPAKFEL